MDTTLEMKPYKLRVLFCQCILVTNGMSGKLLRFVCAKYFKWVNNPLHYKIVILQEEFLLGRKHIERATYVLIICQNLVLNYVFTDGKIS
jgi:hypothetical protein